MKPFTLGGIPNCPCDKCTNVASAKHTAPYLANLVAGAFVLGIKCGTSALGAAAINSTASLESTVLGSCISFNSTISALI